MKRFLVGLLAVTTICPAFAAKQTVAEVKIVPSQGGETEHFGASVSVDGDYAIIGAPAPNHMGEGGSAFVYKRDGQTLVEQTRLTRLGGEEMELFGQSVAISGDYAVVGVPGHDIGIHIDPGSAFVYRRDGEGWVEQAMLVAGDPGGGDEFGHSVAIDGDYIIVGALHGDVNGCAYIFMRNGEEWVQQAKLVGGGGPLSDQFGYSVAIDGPYAIVGDPEDTKQGPGSAYVFVRDGTGWSQQAKLAGTNGEAMGMFGAAVAIDGDCAVVGAPDESPKEPFSHSAGVGHIFRRNGTGWTEEAMLRMAEPEDIDVPDCSAGVSVSISGSSVVLGATGGVGPSAGGLARTGVAYLYQGGGGNWEGVQKLVPGDGIEGGSFGPAVSISGDLIIVGATHTHPLAHESGSAYAYGVTSAQQRPRATPKIAVEPLEDHLFWDDDGGFQLTIRHAGYEDGEGGEQGAARSTAWESVTVGITVNTPPEFLEGDLVTQTFLLPPKEKKQFDVEVVDLLPLIRNFERDVLFGANVQIKAWQEDDPETLIFDDEFNIYRYLDAADDEHDDRTMSLAPTYRDGRDGDATRKREVELWGVHEEAEAEFEIDPAEEFRVEMAPPLATFIFDPSAGNQLDHFIEDLQVRNKRKDRVAGTLFIAGKGTPTYNVFLNKRELVATLERIAVYNTPAYHLHTALLTNDEAVLVRSAPVRQRIADRVQARMEQLLEAVSPAIKFVESAGDPKTTIVYSWPTRLNGPRANPGPEPVSADYWPERLGEVDAVTNPIVGPFGHAGAVDNVGMIYRHLRNRENYSRAELHYRLATAINMTPHGGIEIFVDSIMEHVGTGEPLTLNEDQIVNAVAKTALHELGHDLGVLHTAAMTTSPVPARKLEHQRIVWDGGDPGGSFFLGFNGEEIAEPLPRDATAAQIGYALRGLDSIWGPNISIPEKSPLEDGFPRWVKVRFGNVFAGADVPLLTARRNPEDEPPGGDLNELLDIWVEVALPEGQVGRPEFVGRGAATQLVFGVPGNSRGDWDIMTGGLNDTQGKLRFLPELGLTGLRIGLHLGYDEEEIENYTQVLEQHYHIATQTKGRGEAWDSAD